MQLIKNKVLFFLAFILVFTIFISNNISSQVLPAVDNCKVIPGAIEYYDPNGCDCSPVTDVANRNNILYQESPSPNNTIIWSNDYCLTPSYTPCCSPIPPSFPTTPPPYNEANYIGDYAECELNGNEQPGETNEICMGDPSPDDVQRNFCLGNKWNECDGASFCEEKMTSCFNFDSKSIAKCLKGDYNKEKKRCHYCVHLGGTGGKKIVFLIINGDNTLNDGRGLMNGVIGTQPYKYLYENGKLDFYMVLGKTSDFIKPTDNVDWSIQRDAYLDTLDQYFDYAKEKVCSGGDAYILVDKAYTGRPFVNKGMLPGSSVNNMGNEIVSTSGSQSLAHELGHVLCKLADEYSESNSPQLSGAKNIEYNPQLFINPTTRLETWVCPNFDAMVDRPNCFPISWRNSRIGMTESHRASTSTSLMRGSASNSMFNIVSCAGCMEKLGGGDALARCKSWTPVSVIPQG